MSTKENLGASISDDLAEQISDLPREDLNLLVEYGLLQRTVQVEDAYEEFENNPTWQNYRELRNSMGSMAQASTSFMSGGGVGSMSQFGMGIFSTIVDILVQLWNALKGTLRQYIPDPWFGILDLVITQILPILKPIVPFSRQSSTGSMLGGSQMELGR